MRNIVFAAVTAHQIDLVFHQCNQWRNDNGNSFFDHCRQLVAQAFSSAGRHDHKSVFTIQQCLYDCFLRTFKSIETKMLLKLTGKICCITR